MIHCQLYAVGHFIFASLLLKHMLVRYVRKQLLVSRNMDMMDIDKIIEKTQQYERLRSELITEIQLMVSRARTLIESLNSLAATDDSINDISEYEMYEELYCLEDIDENNDLEMTRYFNLVIDFKYKLDSLEELLGNKIR